MNFSTGNVRRLFIIPSAWVLLSCCLCLRAGLRTPDGHTNSECRTYTRQWCCTFFSTANCRFSCLFLPKSSITFLSAFPVRLFPELAQVFFQYAAARGALSSSVSFNLASSLCLADKLAGLPPPSTHKSGWTLFPCRRSKQRSWDMIDPWQCRSEIGKDWTFSKNNAVLIPSDRALYLLSGGKTDAGAPWGVLIDSFLYIE